MKKDSIYLKAIVNILLYLISAAIVILILPRAISFFAPFVVGWIISLIANPVVKFFEEKIRFKRKAMSAIMIVLIIAIIILAGYGILSVFIIQGMGFVKDIPNKWDMWQRNLDSFGRTISSNLPSKMGESLSSLGTKLQDAVTSFISSLGNNTEFSQKFISGLSSSIGSVASMIIGIIMCVLSAYLFTAEHNNLKASIQKYSPKAFYEKLEAAFRGLQKAVSGYIKAQLKIEFWVYLITLIGLLILGVDYAVIIALLIALLDILPFFGAGLVMVPWGIIHLFNGNYFLGVGLLITWGVGQLFRQLIQPKIVGDSVGLPPIPTLFVLFIGYKLLGVFGMVVSIPIALILIALYEEGVFATFMGSFIILRRGIAEYRKLPDEALNHRFAKKNWEEDKENGVEKD